METVLIIIGCLIAWLACGAYFVGRAAGLEKHGLYIEAVEKQSPGPWSAEARGRYIDHWEGYAFFGCLFWPALAVNVFAHEVKQDTMTTLQAKYDKQKELLEAAERMKNAREMIERELAG